MYKEGDLLLKAVIPSWVIYGIEVLCGFANIFVQTLPSFKTYALRTIPLFKTMMRQNASWGRYAVYITWLHRHFPSQGYIVFRYLKRHQTAWTYSFPYLVWQYLLYHGSKIIHGLCRSFTTRLSGRNCKICQSPQDTPKESETTTGTAS